MRFECPQCRSVRVMPAGDNRSGVRPHIPLSLILLMPSGIAWLILTLVSIGFKPAIIYHCGIFIYVSIGYCLLAADACF